MALFQVNKNFYDFHVVNLEEWIEKMDNSSLRYHCYLRKRVFIYIRIETVAIYTLFVIYDLSYNYFGRGYMCLEQLIEKR